MAPNGTNKNESKSYTRILLAEDNDTNYLLLKIILKGYNLTRVDNGEKAVKKAKELLFNIILMDIRMPIMDGLAAIKAIREFDKDIPILAITADVDKQKEASNAGCNEFIAKPFKTSELLKSINYLLSGQNHQYCID